MSNEIRSELTLKRLSLDAIEHIPQKFVDYCKKIGFVSHNDILGLYNLDFNNADLCKKLSAIDCITMSKIAKEIISK